MKKCTVCMLILVILLTACAPLKNIGLSAGLLAKTALAGITGSGVTSTPAPTIAPSVTPTPSQLDTPVTMTDGGSFKAWDLVNVIDPDKPDLILDQGDSFALDTAWEVDRAEFVYKWWGSEAPLMDYQYLWASSSGYSHSNGRSIKQEDMRALLEAISNLQPQVNFLSSVTHEQDFHAWYMELTGVDGETVLIQSTSNSDVQGAPWNVYYNGRFFAQFDGSLMPAIQKIFPHERFILEYPYFETGSIGFVPFSVRRDGRWLIPSFTGLLPLRGDLEYIAGVGDEGFVLYIRGIGISGFIPEYAMSVVMSVDRVEVTDPDGKKIRCSISDKSSGYAGWIWTIRCPVSQFEEEPEFNFPIEIVFKSIDGKNHTSKGELKSYWNFPEMNSPLNLPEDLAHELAINPYAAPLWEDHIVYDLEYLGSLKDDDPQRGTLYGEAILLGETERNGKPLMYTVSTPFAFENGKLTRWDLTRELIDESLDRVLSYQISDRILNLASDASVNLYIARQGSTPRIATLLDFEPVKYEARTQVCATNQKLDLPTAQKPFIGFALNGSWYKRGSDTLLFILADDQIVPITYRYVPAWDDPVSEALKPILLNDPRFKGMNMMGLDTNPYSKPEIFVWLNDNISTRGKSQLRDVLEDAFGVSSLDRSEDTFWIVRLVGLVVDPDGTMDFVKCD